jgi:DNA-binding transcriptional MerR regulator
MSTEMNYTVKQLAQIAGVSARTLHYYDEINLLKPDRHPGNGYRLYTWEAALRLQQILFLRELGLALEDIRLVLEQPGFDLLDALEQHRKALLERQERLGQLIHTVERTILHLKGNVEMESNELFQGFSEEEQEKYAEEARQRWGKDNVDESMRRWGSYSKEKQQAVLSEGGRIYQDIIALFDHRPDSPEVQACVARWHQNLRNFYEPTPEILRGLGDLYNDDPQFNATFVKMHPDLAPFMREAIRAYVDHMKT